MKAYNIIEVFQSHVGTKFYYTLTPGGAGVVLRLMLDCQGHKKLVYEERPTSEIPLNEESISREYYLYSEPKCFLDILTVVRDGKFKDLNVRAEHSMLNQYNEFKYSCPFDELLAKICRRFSDYDVAKILEESEYYIED